MIELSNLEIAECCTLDETTGQVNFYKGEKLSKGYTGLYFRDDNTFFAVYPSKEGAMIHFKGKNYPLTDKLIISLAKSEKQRTFRIDDYDIEINYIESPYIGFDSWSDEIDVDLFYKITQLYKDKDFHDRHTLDQPPILLPKVAKEPSPITKPLPLGSIVLLKGSEKRLMITGFLQKQADSETVWHYSGVLFPEGMQNSSNLFLFNEDQIEMVFFIGMQDT